MEEIVLNIIIHSGNAKAKLYEALQASKENDFDKADQILKEADEEVLNAHIIQTHRPKFHIHHSAKHCLLPLHYPCQN